jgi:hypothetical protein
MNVNAFFWWLLDRQQYFQTTLTKGHVPNLFKGVRMALG